MKIRSVISCCTAALLGLMLHTASATAGDIALGNLLPGGGLVSKRVVSIHESRFTNLVRQHTDFSCGAAALATILKYAYGLGETDEAQVLEEMLKVADSKVVFEKGFSLLDIKRFVRNLGMQAVGFKIQAENLHQIKVPAIVLIDIKGYKHFVVFRTARNGRVHIGDPALGNKVMSQEEFVAAWNGVVLAVVADFYQEDTVLTQAHPQISARNLLTKGDPVVDAQPFDFGLRSLDLLKF